MRFTGRRVYNLIKSIFSAEWSSWLTPDVYLIAPGIESRQFLFSGLVFKEKMHCYHSVSVVKLVGQQTMSFETGFEFLNELLIT